MSRYKDPRTFFLGVDPKVQSVDLPGGKLPTFRQVLICYNARKDKCRNGDKILFEVATKLIQDQIQKLYSQAKVPLRDYKTLAKEIVAVHKEMYDLMRIPKHRRNTNTSQKRIQKFQSKLDKTMPLWTSDALQKIVIKEDREFLVSMMTDRKAVMAGVDSKLAATEKKVAERRDAQLKRVHSEEKRKLESTTIYEEEPNSSELQIQEDMDTNNQDLELGETKRKHQRTVKTGQSMFIPHDILKSPLVVSAAVRNKVKPTGLAEIASAIINTCGGDTQRFNLNHTQSYR